MVPPKNSPRRTVFADAGYWIAISNPREELHQRARNVAEELAPFRIVTSEMVLGEVLTFATNRGKHARRIAVQMVRRWMADEEIEVIPQTSQLFCAALDMYASRLDKAWSLTDCASFVIMESMNIQEALAEDHDFEQAGFVAKLRHN